MRWSVSIALLLNASVAAAASEDKTPPPDASTLYTTTLSSKIGTGQGVQNNLVSPMVNGTPLTTPDGSTSFNSTTLTPSDKPLMKINVMINPPSGDISSVEVDQDLNGSGTLGTVTVFPNDNSGQMISGICANGYIQCTAGRFDSSCGYFRWDTDSITGQVGAVSNTSVRGMISCYCFNQACATINNTAVANLDSLTADLAGGLIANFVSASGYAVTQTTSSGSGVVTIFGVKPTVRKAPDNFSPPASTATGDLPVNPYTDTVALTSSAADDQKSGNSTTNSMGQTSQSSQESLPNSLLNLVSNATSSQSGQRFTCRNSRVVTFTTPSITVSQTGTAPQGSWCTDTLINTMVTKTGPSTWKLSMNNNLTPSCPAQSWDVDTYSPLPSVPAAQAANYTITEVDLNVTLLGNGCTGGSNNVTTWFPVNGANTITQLTNLSCTVAGHQFPGASWLWTATYTQQVLTGATVDNCTTNIDDGCSPYELDTAHCRLEEDIWDKTGSFPGTLMVHNGASTGMQVIDTQKLFPGPIRTVTLSCPWYTQDRIFTCHYDNPSIPNPDITRVNAAQTSATLTGTTMTYTGGGPQTLPAAPPDGPAPQTCKTSTPVAQTENTTYGTRAGAQTPPAASSSEFTFQFKECLLGADGTTFTCPLTAPEETIVTPCSPSSDFGEAIAASAAVDNAQDVTCSSK